MNEGYPPDWVRVDCMVSERGEIHAIGGLRDPEEGEGDRPYVGLDRIMARIAALTTEVARLGAETDKLREELTIEKAWNIGSKAVITSLEAENAKLRASLAALTTTEDHSHEQ